MRLSTYGIDSTNYAARPHEPPRSIITRNVRDRNLRASSSSFLHFLLPMVMSPSSRTVSKTPSPLCAAPACKSRCEGSSPAEFERRNEEQPVENHDERSTQRRPA